jgi:catechol 2,3-dioxygenase-like lactoylglutathione lyase family enzyme
VERSPTDSGSPERDDIYRVGMASRVSHTSINCTDAYELSEWWKRLLGYTDVVGDPNEAGDEECMIVDPESGHHLLFIEVGRLQEADGRIHLDLAPTDQRRDDEIDRAIGLGATEVADRRNADGTGWMVLSDPAGNLFCIVRSDEERRTT